MMPLHAGGRLREELREGVGERELPFLDEEHHHGRGELLPHRARLEDRLGLHRDLVLDVGEAVALRLHHLAAAHDRDGHAGHLLPLHLGADETRPRGRGPRKRPGPSPGREASTTSERSGGSVARVYSPVHDPLPRATSHRPPPRRRRPTRPRRPSRRCASGTRSPRPPGSRRCRSATAASARWCSGTRSGRGWPSTRTRCGRAGRRSWNNPDAKTWLPKVREAVFAGRYAEADALAKKMQGPYNQSYQPLGDLLLDFDVPGQVEGYRRELDLDRAVATSTFRAGGALHTREVFASFPDQVVVLRVSADRPGQVSFTARLAQQAAPRHGGRGRGRDRPPRPRAEPRRPELPRRDEGRRSATTRARTPRACASPRS